MNFVSFASPHMVPHCFAPAHFCMQHPASALLPLECRTIFRERRGRSWRLPTSQSLAPQPNAGCCGSQQAPLASIPRRPCPATGLALGAGFLTHRFRRSVNYFRRPARTEGWRSTACKACRLERAILQGACVNSTSLLRNLSRNSFLRICFVESNLQTRAGSCPVQMLQALRQQEQ